MDLNSGMAFAVTQENTCQQMLDTLRCGPDPEHSDFSGLERAGALADRVRIKQKPPAAHQQVLALRCKPNAPSRPRKQPQAQLILQRLDLPRGSRLGQVPPRGCACEARAVGDFD